MYAGCGDQGIPFLHDDTGFNSSFSFSTQSLSQNTEHTTFQKALPYHIHEWLSQRNRLYQSPNSIAYRHELESIWQTLVLQITTADWDVCE